MHSIQQAKRSLTNLGLKGMNLGHRVVLVGSGGRLFNRFGGMATVELHTVGRKSGKPRRTLLTAPISDADRVVIVASRGGDDRHPDWYFNLQAQPDVELVIDGQSRLVRARTATPAEKESLWPTIVAAFKGYDGYQRRTDRDIPVVICENRAAV